MMSDKDGIYLHLDLDDLILHTHYSDYLRANLPADTKELCLCTSHGKGGVSWALLFVS